MTATPTVLKTAPQAPEPLDVDAVLCGVDRIKALNGLAASISRVRDRNDSVDFNTKHDPNFAKRLESCDFGRNDVDWDIDIADGMEALHNVVGELLDGISNALEASR